MNKLTKKEILDMMAKEAPEAREHTKLSASWSNIWLNCTKATELTELFPDIEITEDYASEGTMAHFLAELILNGEITLDQVPTDFAELEIFIDKVKEIQAEGQLFVEVSTDMTEVFESHTPIRGRSDVVVLHKDDTIDVIDLKWGKGVWVNAHKNTQLMIYAVGVVKYLTDLGIYDITKLSNKLNIHIIQPRLDVSYTFYQFDLEELFTFILTVKNKLKQIAKKEFNLAQGDYCQFCKGKAYCPIFAATTVEVIVEAKEELADISPERLLDIYSMKADVMAYFRAVEKTIKAQIMLSKTGEYGGYKLIMKEGSREVIDEGALIKQLTDAGADLKEIQKTSLLGITMIDKIAKKYGIAKQDLQGIAKKQTESLVPVKDKLDSVFEVIE